MSNELRPKGSGRLERITCASFLAVGGALSFGGCAAVFSDAKGADYNQIALALGLLGLCTGYVTPYVSAWVGSRIKRRKYNSEE